jgi:hypothetical protein
MALIDNIRTYFNKKRNDKTIESAPEGICPNCWGKEQWDNEFYEMMNGSKNNKRDNTYNNFLESQSIKARTLVQRVKLNMITIIK